MYGLPKATELKKPLAKTAIYKKFALDTAAKDRFDSDIAKLFIACEISQETTTLAPGESVERIYILQVMLKNREYNSKNIELLCKLIDHRIIFVLEHENMSRIALYHTKLMCGEWQNTDDVTIQLGGLDLEKVWENMVLLIGGYELKGDNTLEVQIAEDDTRAKVLKQIELLENKARKEKQPRKKLELVGKINELRKEIK